jgi:hypothetical protein
VMLSLGLRREMMSVCVIKLDWCCGKWSCGWRIGLSQSRRLDAQVGRGLGKLGSGGFGMVIGWMDGSSHAPLLRIVRATRE